MNAHMQEIRNKTWNELDVGDSASIRRTVTDRDLFLFAHASGNYNPVNLPGFSVPKEGEIHAPSMWIAALTSSVLGNVLPGPGTMYRHQAFDFAERANVGDHLTISLTLTEKHECPDVTFSVLVTNQNGQDIAKGTARVSAPTVSHIIKDAPLPSLLLDEVDHFARLLQLTKKLDPMPTAVVCPDDIPSLGGALMARDEGLIEPILIGNEAAIRAAALAGGLDISGLEIISISDHGAASAKAVSLVHEKKARAILKGNVHSDELLAHIVKRDAGLRGPRRISHVFVLDVPSLNEPLFISDAAINIAPDLHTKVDIIQNAIDLARACGIDQPRVAILSAVETVNMNIPSSMDAAILAKMADRGQIKGGIVDGPLAMDNAIDMAAAQTKHLISPVAGRAQVLIVPNLEAGNMLAKQLTFVSQAQPAGLVLGAQVPIMLTSRADNERARLFSCVLALLYDSFKTGKTQ